MNSLHGRHPTDIAELQLDLRHVGQHLEESWTASSAAAAPACRPSSGRRGRLRALEGLGVLLPDALGDLPKSFSACQTKPRKSWYSTGLRDPPLGDRLLVLAHRRAQHLKDGVDDEGLPVRRLCLDALVGRLARRSSSAVSAVRQVVRRLDGLGERLEGGGKGRPRRSSGCPGSCRRSPPTGAGSAAAPRPSASRARTSSPTRRWPRISSMSR